VTENPVYAFPSGASLKMNLFHQDYMTSNLAAKGFVRRIENFTIDAILPQHVACRPRLSAQLALWHRHHLC